MNSNDAIDCLNKELKLYHNDLIDNIHAEIIGSGIYFGSSFSIAYLMHLFCDRISFEQTIIPAFTIPILLTIKNHNIYAQSADVKQNVKFLKSLKR